VAWAVLLVAAVSGNMTNAIVLVFFGWLIGWTSATIARVVYPPPKPREATTDAP
jgi:hypothetical protein